MKLRNWIVTAAAAVVAMPLAVGSAGAYELTIPSMDYRTGALCPERHSIREWLDRLLDNAE